jgi:benzoyl-CoA 2,3-epoxidase subunit B
VADTEAGVARWNRVLTQAGVPFRITLPHVAFNRRIGEFAAIHADTNGDILTAEAWNARRAGVLPTPDDNAFIASLMRPERGRGAYAPWIAPPRHGIDNRPGDFEYVKIEG